MTEKKPYLDMESKLSLRRQPELLEVDRSCFYLHPVGESSLNILLIELIDNLLLDDPALGLNSMRDEIRDLGYENSVKRIRRLIGKIALMPIYAKKNLSRLGLANYILPYLLRHLAITRPNQVRAIDITCFPMRHGFMCLTAVIDVYSRFVIGWQLSNNLVDEN